MANLEAFWSYVQDDDKAEVGRIRRLGKDIVAQFEMITGEKITLFIDEEKLKWGENWKERIDENLSSVAFFIPVITPRYFLRPECRHELEFFARKTINLGIQEIILPLYYMDSIAFNDSQPADELIKLVHSFQWEDWRDIRFCEISSENYRRGIYKLANRLAEANKKPEQPIKINNKENKISITEEPDDSLGEIDKLALYENKLEILPATLNSIKDEIVSIGEKAKKNSEDLNKSDLMGKGFQARKILLSVFANELKEPVDKIFSLSNIYASQLHDVDTGYRIIIAKAPIEITENSKSKIVFCKLFHSVRNLSASATDMVNSFKKMIDVIEPMEKLSRDLRLVLWHLKKGLTILIESSKVCEEWIQLIEKTEIRCEEPDIVDEIQEIL